MRHTAAARKEFEEILELFRDFIQEQNYFDIVYSDKLGYLRIFTENPGCDGVLELETLDDLLDELYHEIINEIYYSPKSQRLSFKNMEEHDAYRFAKADRRVKTVLDTVTDTAKKAYYQQRWEKSLHWRMEQCKQTR